MKNLKLLRLNSGLTLEKMAKETGISNQMLSNYELEKSNPSVNTILKIADFFGCSTDYLLGHRTPNKAKYSAEQLAVLEELEKLDNEQCFAILAFIEGMKSGKEQQNKILARFRQEADET